MNPDAFTPGQQLWQLEDGEVYGCHYKGPVLDLTEVDKRVLARPLTFHTVIRARLSGETREVCALTRELHTTELAARKAQVAELSDRLRTARWALRIARAEARAAKSNPPHSTNE